MKPYSFARNQYIHSVRVLGSLSGNALVRHRIHHMRKKEATERNMHNTSTILYKDKQSPFTLCVVVHTLRALRKKQMI